MASKHVRYPNSEIPFLYWRNQCQTKYVNKNDMLYNRAGTFILKLKDPYGQYQTRMVYEGSVRVWEDGARFVFRSQQSVREGTWKDSLRNVEVFMASGGVEGGAGERPYFLCMIHVPHGQGVLKRSDGTVLYEGSWKDGNRDGSGDGEFEDGRYFGEWRTGRMDGEGVYTARTGESVSGKFIEDILFDGHGTLKRKHGDVWKGDWRSGAFKGSITYSNGDKFEGELTAPKWAYPTMPSAAPALVATSSSTSSGAATAMPPAAAVNSGQLTVDRMLNPVSLDYDPEAEMLLRSSWERQLQEGVRQGPGKETLVTGGTYVGYWQVGVRHGFGAFQWPDKHVDHLFYQMGNLMHMRSAGYGGQDPSGSSMAAQSASMPVEGGVGSGAAYDILSKELETLRMEKNRYMEDLQGMTVKQRELNDHISTVERECLLLRAERDQLHRNLEEEMQKRAWEEQKRKTAEIFIERLDEEMKNLQQVQQRRIQTRLDEVRRSMEAVDSQRSSTYLNGGASGQILE